MERPAPPACQSSTANGNQKQCKHPTYCTADDFSSIAFIIDSIAVAGGTARVTFCCVEGDWCPSSGHNILHT